jgi:2'-5' RNA ligase
MRLFIAANFTDETRSRLLALRDELRSRSERGNFSAPENLHLTLAFLGECDAKQAAAAKAAMDAINFVPFNAVIDRVGRFKRDGGDIWWAGLREDKALMGAQRDLANRLSIAGFNLETRKYSPHITLGREMAADCSFGKIEPFGEAVKRIELMKSERVSGKLAYTAVYVKKGTEKTNSKMES